MSTSIAVEVIVSGDIRYMDGAQRDRAFSEMKSIVSKHLPGTSADIHLEEVYPPMSPTDGNLRLQAIHSQASKDAGLGAIAVLPPTARGAGDVQFVAHYVESLDGLGGAGGDEAHIRPTNIWKHRW
jgi:glutamate carboxypeptidase